MKPLRDFYIEVHVPGGRSFRLPEDKPDEFPEISYFVSEESQIATLFRLRDLGSDNRVALDIQRQTVQVTDLAKIAQDDWINNLSDKIRSQAAVKLVSLARVHLRISDAEATLSNDSNSEWSRYRESQQAILNSLQETQRTILQEFTRKSLELELNAQQRIQEHELVLKTKYEALESKLTKEDEDRKTALEAREVALGARESSFNTKEARYVARQEQKNQIEQIQGWLNDWSLTKGTRSKRYPVAIAYLIGISITGFLTYWLSQQSIDILKIAAADFSKVAWWQWVFISLKSILPLAALITFVISFIRWSSAWARQHAEEEFRNRARLLDIGRTAWLLEAVRDAQDNQKELPPDLVKELARNLFSYSSTIDSTDLHPQTVTDLIMQGLSSLRLKTPDGTELEAKRRILG